MRNHSRSILILCLVLCAALGGCRRMHIYGDSTINTANVLAPGDLTRNVILYGHAAPTAAQIQASIDDPDKEAWIHEFEDAVGYPTWSHPLRTRISANNSDNNPNTTILSAFMDDTLFEDFAERFDVAVYSLGTNDAIHYALYDAGRPGGIEWVEQDALNRVDYLWKRAVSAGANCVIWVLPSEHYTGAWTDIADSYQAYMKIINDHLRGLQGSRTHAGNAFKFKVAEWGAHVTANNGTLDDGIHPNASGAVAMGNLIRNKVQYCPTGRWNTP